MHTFLRRLMGDLTYLEKRDIFVDKLGQVDVVQRLQDDLQLVVLFRLRHLDLSGRNLRSILQYSKAMIYSRRIL